VSGVYILSTGCQRAALPKDLPPRSTVNDYMRRWTDDGTIDHIDHVLYVKCREKADRNASPAASIIDSQSVKGGKRRRTHRSIWLRRRQENQGQEALTAGRHARPADVRHDPHRGHPGP
jgi:transposase